MEKEQKICRRTRRVYFCCKKAVVDKKQQHLHKNAHSSSVALARPHYEVALREDRAAGGGHYKASAWKQCKKQWGSWFLHEEDELHEKALEQYTDTHGVAAAVLRCAAVFADVRH